MASPSTASASQQPARAAQAALAHGTSAKWTPLASLVTTTAHSKRPRLTLNSRSLTEVR